MIRCDKLSIPQKFITYNNVIKIETNGDAQFLEGALYTIGMIEQDIRPIAERVLIGERARRPS